MIPLALQKRRPFNAGFKLAGKNQLKPIQEYMWDAQILSNCCLVRNSWPKPTGVLEHRHEWEINWWFSIFCGVSFWPHSQGYEPTNEEEISLMQQSHWINTRKFRERFEATLLYNIITKVPKYYHFMYCLCQYGKKVTTESGKTTTFFFQTRSYFELFRKIDVITF